jgi:hypothetical protein
MNSCVISVKLYRLCWALWNSTEERIDLDAEDKGQEEVENAVEDGNVWLTFDFLWCGSVSLLADISCEGEFYYDIYICAYNVS